MSNSKTVRFYTRGKFMGFKKLSSDIILEVVSWINSGNDIKINNTLINCPNYAARFITSEVV